MYVSVYGVWDGIGNGNVWETGTDTGVAFWFCGDQGITS